MNSKVFILILNVVYLIATIIWAIIDKSVEPIVAIIGGVVSFATFYVANDNSFSINISNPKTNTAGRDIICGRQINMGDESTYNENNLN